MSKQIQDWFLKSSAKSFDEMTNLSKDKRTLSENFEILPISTFKAQRSNDGTIKSAFQLHDKHLVEGVLIPAEPRMTACISSQVGCSLTCSSVLLVTWIVNVT